MPAIFNPGFVALHADMHVLNLIPVSFLQSLVLTGMQNHSNINGYIYIYRYIGTYHLPGDEAGGNGPSKMKTAKKDNQEKGRALSTPVRSELISLQVACEATSARSLFTNWVLD